MPPCFFVRLLKGNQYPDRCAKFIRAFAYVLSTAKHNTVLSASIRQRILRGTIVWETELLTINTVVKFLATELVSRFPNDSESLVGDKYRLARWALQISRRMVSPYRYVVPVRAKTLFAVDSYCTSKCTHASNVVFSV